LVKASPLHGVFEGRPSWPRNERPDESIPLAELLQQRSGEAADVWDSLARSQHDQALWDSAVSDRDAGKALGPFWSLGELSEALANQPFLLQRRFGAVQPDKVRACDDYLRSGGNSASFFKRRAKLPTVDTFMSLCYVVATIFQCDVNFWKRDHASAYRQVLLDIASLCLAAYAFRSPCGSRVAFLHLANPFGASAAVTNYLRLGHALTFLAREMFVIPVDSFFDDYWGVIPVGHPYAQSFDVFGELNSILGFEIKIKKDVPPGAEGPLLGHHVKLAFPPELRNTPSRIANIAGMVGEALRTDSLSERCAGELAGKSGFACSALWGRCGRAALKPVFARQHRRVHSNKRLSKQLRAALLWLRRVFVEVPARPILLRPSGHHLVAYSDAAGTGCIAAVLFPGAPRVPLWTRAFVPPELVARFCKRATQIHMYEALAALLLLETFRAFLTSRELVLFVDNASAKGSLVRGFSSAEDLCAVASAFWEVCAHGRINPYFEWVPSKLNVADGPSRPEEPGSMAFLQQIGARYVTPRLEVWARVEDYLARLGL
jgi:hypothetical protein